LLKRGINPIFLVLAALLLFNAVRGGTFSNPGQWLMGIVYILPGVVIAISFHEFAHGWVAYKLGDMTPKYQGRLTVSPLAHIDPIGLLALIFAGFGWGVPVQINPNNFKHRRRDELLVSLAGVVMNLILAIIFGFIMKLIVLAAGNSLLTTTWGDITQHIVFGIIQINLVLMLFNLIPVPPLDGFSIISEIFNIKHTELYYRINQYGFIILVAIILFGIAGRIITPGVSFFYNLILNYIVL